MSDIFERCCQRQLQRYHRALSEPLVFEGLARSPRLGRPLLFRVAGSQGNCYLLSLKADARFECTCPDFETNCFRQGLLCKHICFLLVRVLNISSLSLLQEGRLTAEEVLQVYAQSTNMNQASSQILSNQRFKINRIDARAFQVDRSCPGLLDSECPICCEPFDLQQDQNSQQDGNFLRGLSKCPDCAKVVHMNCALRWFARSPTKTCVMCRSKAWIKFGPSVRPATVRTTHRSHSSTA
jgi:hypothetical protein